MRIKNFIPGDYAIKKDFIIFSMKNVFHISPNYGIDTLTAVGTCLLFMLAGKQLAQA